MSLIGTHSGSSWFTSDKKSTVYGDLWSGKSDSWLHRVIDECRAPQSILFRNHDSFSVFVLDGQVWREHAHLPDQSNAGAFRSFRYLLGRLAPNSRALPLRLDASYIACRRFEVKATSIVGTRRKIEKQLSELCSWPIEESWGGYVCLPRPKDSEATPVVAAFSQKSKMDELAVSLEKLGVSPSQVEFADVTSDSLIPINPLSKVKPKPKSKWLSRFLWFAVAGSLFVAGAGTILVSQLDTKIARVNAQISDAQAIIANKGLGNSAERLKSWRRVTVLQTLEALAANLPKSANLTQIEIRDGRVKLSGRTSNSDGLLEAFRDSGILKNVEFAKPTVRLVDQNVDIFTVSASLKSARGD